MVLRPEQFTEKALAVIQKSQEILAEYKHTQWDTEHLLLAMLDEKDGVTSVLFIQYWLLPIFSVASLALSPQ